MSKLLVLILGASLYAQTSFSACGNHRDDIRYRNLNWVKAAVYEVNSPYADVSGVLCAGLLGERLDRIHYRDSQGTKVYKNRSQLMRQDTVFFGKDDFPAAARWVMRSEDPLTLKVLSERRGRSGGYQYELSAKFLRNPRKGFSSPDVRELRLDYSTSYNETFYKDALIDGIYLNISGALSINEVVLVKNSRRVLSVSPYQLPSASRY